MLSVLFEDEAERKWKGERWTRHSGALLSVILESYGQKKRRRTEHEEKEEREVDEEEEAEEE